MPQYETQRAIVWSDGTTWPKGSTLLVTWGEYPASRNRVEHNGVVKHAAGYTLGRAIEGERPTIEQLMGWSMDGVCPTPTGHSVEPDGHGPDGCPSWLILTGHL